MILKRIIRKIIVKLGILIFGEINTIARLTLPKFGNEPKNLNIELPRRIKNPQYIFLGDNINIGPGSLLIAITEYPGSSMKHPEEEVPVQRFNPSISIGHRVSSTGGLQIAAHDNITVEDDVMFASNINITDGLHGYENADEPYKYQKIFRIAPIRVKRGCWIGQNVVIMPGVTIGEFSIIGANSVVTKSIPDRSIASGSPAKVLKKWNDSDQKWVVCNDE